MIQATVYPSTVNNPAQRAFVYETYQYPGGPLAQEDVYAEGAQTTFPALGSLFPAPTAASVREVVTTYTAEGQVAGVSGSTQPATYTYDARGRVIQMADGNGNKTLYDYDPIGNLWHTYYPLASGQFDTTTDTYDDDQNLIKEVDGRGVTTAYTRADPESLVTQVVYSTLPSGVTALAPVNYTYDDFGRRSGMNDGDGSMTGSYKYTYGYDDLDELLSQTVSFTGGPQNQVLAYAHNNDSSRLSLTIPSNVNNLPLANSGKFSYAYDGVGRLAQLIQPWSQGNHSGTSIDGQWNYQYQPNGWLTDTWNGQIGSTTAYLHTQYAYTPRGFLASLNNSLYDPQTSPAQLQLSSMYTGIPSTMPMAYDAVGNRLGETVSIPSYTNASLGSSADASHQITYSYDTGHSPASLNRDVLTGEASTLFGSGSNVYHDVYTNNYGYDAAYNPTAYSVGGTAVSLPVNLDNQFNVLGQFAFDGSGNPTTYSDPTGLYSSSTPPTFTYDPEDRLTSTSSPSLTAAYDGDGMRIKKTTVYGTTYYLYDGGSVPVVEEGYDSGATPPAYLSGINTVGADGQIRAFFLNADGQGPSGTRKAAPAGQRRGSLVGFGLMGDAHKQNPGSIGGGLGIAAGQGHQCPLENRRVGRDGVRDQLALFRMGIIRGSQSRHNKTPFGNGRFYWTRGERIRVGTVQPATFRLPYTALHSGEKAETATHIAPTRCAGSLPGGR